MTVLCGALADVGLPPLLRFLVHLGQSGQLRIARGQWGAELAFDRGQLVAAAIGEDRGPGVLEAIVLALSDGEFTFTEGALLAADNMDADSTSLQVRVEALASVVGTMSPTISLLSMVPQLVVPTSEEGLLRLDRPTLNVLLNIDGRRNVEEIAALLGLVQATNALVVLCALGLVCFAAPNDRARAGPPMMTLGGAA
jgi:hypothetical protein